jgi:hypothetical protein
VTPVSSLDCSFFFAFFLVVFALGLVALTVLVFGDDGGLTRSLTVRGRTRNSSALGPS